MGSGVPAQPTATEKRVPDNPNQRGEQPSRFPNPIYSKWFCDYNKMRQDVRINGSEPGNERL